ncbi:hypothetical protein DWZ54_08235 [Mitsuokella sp. AF33-22]|nr:hypothetical protein DWZ54_08235 [Mitsuokella sp. AF33-22]
MNIFPAILFADLLLGHRRILAIGNDRLCIIDFHNVSRRIRCFLIAFIIWDNGSVSSKNRGTAHHQTCYYSQCQLAFGGFAVFFILSPPAGQITVFHRFMVPFFHLLRLPLSVDSCFISDELALFVFL